MIEMLRRVLSLLLVTALLASCGVLIRPAETFLSSQDDFGNRLRWRDCSGAGRYLAAEHKSEFLEFCLSDDNLHFVSVESQGVTLAEDQRSAETVTLVEYYRLPSMVVKKYWLEQQWRYHQPDDNKNGSWQITSPFPLLP